MKYPLVDDQSIGQRARAGFSRLLLCSAFLALSWAQAQALPSPKDIENAVDAGRYTQAEAMLKEVLHEKPSSAKAHYELGQVLAKEDHLGESRQELLEAQRLDPSLKFAKSPEKFKEILERVSAAETAAQTMPPHATNAVNAQPVMRTQEQSSFPWGYVVLAIGVMFLLGLIIRRIAPSPVVYAPAPSPYGPMGPGGVQTGPGYGQAYGPGYGPAPGYGPSGSGLGGAVVGGLAGVAAGYALSKAMEGGEHHSDGSSSMQNNGGYVPFDQPQAPDIGSFDSGSGSGWDDNSSGGGSDDSSW